MLKPHAGMEIPEETKRTAKAAFPKGSLYITLRDELGPLFEDDEFANLYPSLGQPAESPARLALITIMQFLENLTDRQAAESVRSRIDWKYMLGLELSDSGFHYSVLSEFRLRLVSGGAEQKLLDRLLMRCEELGLLKGKKKQRTDSTHVLAAIRSTNLLELVGETMRRVLDEIARLTPEWLTEHLQPEWIKRYGRPFDSYHLPKSKAKREQLAVQIGQDGFYLLKAIYAETGPEELKESAKVETLRRIWVQQFYYCEGEVFWRTKKKWGQPPAGKMIASPEDQEARYCVKRSTEWTGYKVHLTETCDPDHPRIITQVATTPSTIHDVKVTRKIQQELVSRDLSPETHLVDEGYMEIDLLVESQKRGIDLVGPVPSSKSWQDREEGAFNHSQFEIDWERMIVTCPNNKTSIRWSVRKTWRGTRNLLFVFDKADCLPCPLRKRCSRAKNVGRTLTIYPQEQYEAQKQARERQQTEAFKQLYGERAGIESTISQSVRTMGLRYARYIGLDRTHLQHVATAVAINLVRVFSWLTGERPQETRVSPFLALAAQT
jgi:transposase